MKKRTFWIIILGVIIGGLCYLYFHDYSLFQSILRNLIQLWIIFAILEIILPHKLKKKILRSELLLDIQYFFVNYIFSILAIIYINFLIQKYIPSAIINFSSSYIQNLHVWLQIIIIIIIGDFIQYWLHRMFHEIPFLWKFHKIHHSATEMDWLVKSRLHIIENFANKLFIVTPIIILWFSISAINFYAIFIWFYTVFIHSNINIYFWPIEKIFVSPKFHHWHHANDKEAINKNYAAEISFLDTLFWTYLDKKEYPKEYWLYKDTSLPKAFLKQIIYPFIKTK